VPFLKKKSGGIIVARYSSQGDWRGPPSRSKIGQGGPTDGGCRQKRRIWGMAEKERTNNSLQSTKEETVSQGRKVRKKEIKLKRETRAYEAN